MSPFVTRTYSPNNYQIRMRGSGYRFYYHQAEAGGKPPRTVTAAIMTLYSVVSLPSRHLLCSENVVTGHFQRVIMVGRGCGGEIFKKMFTKKIPLAFPKHY